MWSGSGRPQRLAVEINGDGHCLVMTSATLFPLDACDGCMMRSASCVMNTRNQEIQFPTLGSEDSSNQEQNP